MDIKQLQCFISLAHTLNFTKSAELMYISQPAISRQILNLEEEMGVHLFTRDSRGVELTTAGKAFLAEAEKVVVHINNGVSIARQAEKGSTGSLNIGVLWDNIGDHYIELISNFRKKYPKINLVFTEYTPSAITQALSKGTIDIACSFQMDIANNRNTTWKTVLKDHLSVVVSAEHPLSGRDSIDLKELVNEEFVLVDEKDSAKGYNEIVQMCIDYGFTPIVVANAHFIPNLLSLVACGVGISILPTQAARGVTSSYVRFIRLAGIDARPGINQVIAWKTHNDNACLKLFVEELNSASQNSRDND